MPTFVRRSEIVLSTRLRRIPRDYTLEMESIADEMPRIAAKKGNRILIGFAAETQNLEVNALDKLKRKHLDLIVANDVTQEGAGFAVDTNIVTIYGKEGAAEDHPKLTKDEVADLILDRVVALRARKSLSRTRCAPFDKVSARPNPQPLPFRDEETDREHSARVRDVSTRLFPLPLREGLGVRSLSSAVL